MTGRGGFVSAGLTEVVVEYSAGKTKPVGSFVGREAVATRGEDCSGGSHRSKRNQFLNTPGTNTATLDPILNRTLLKPDHALVDPNVRDAFTTDKFPKGFAVPVAEKRHGVVGVKHKPTLPRPRQNGNRIRLQDTRYALFLAAAIAARSAASFL